MIYLALIFLSMLALGDTFRDSLTPESRREYDRRIEALKVKNGLGARCSESVECLQYPDQICLKGRRQVFGRCVWFDTLSEEFE